MKVLLQIDTLRCQCGYAYDYDDANINNGYNCNHPDNEDYEIQKNKHIGKCFTWSCPIAHHADLKDMKKLDSDLYDEYKSEANDLGYLDESDWMVWDGGNYEIQSKT